LEVRKQGCYTQSQSGRLKKRNLSLLLVVKKKIGSSKKKMLKNH